MKYVSMNKKSAVIVSGCNGGIGGALCQEFNAAGYFVIGTDLHDKSKVNCDHYIQCDLLTLSSDESVQTDFLNSLQKILSEQGHYLKALINNAAYQVVNPLCDLTAFEFNVSQQINVTAPFVLASMFLPILKNHCGSIVNVGSIHAHLTKPGFCAYSTSKAALSGLTRALALELNGLVTVNTILPAATKTDMLLAGFQDQPDKYADLEAFHPVGRIAEPEEIAQLALFLCSDKARFITGAEIPIDGGIGRRLHDPA